MYAQKDRDIARNAPQKKMAQNTDEFAVHGIISGEPHLFGQCANGISILR